MSGRRAFGSIRKARSGRFEVRYTGPDGGKYTAGRSFIRKTDASAFLAHVEAEISEGTWTSPQRSPRARSARRRSPPSARLSLSRHGRTAGSRRSSDWVAHRRLFRLTPIG